MVLDQVSQVQAGMTLWRTMFQMGHQIGTYIRVEQHMIVCDPFGKSGGQGMFVTAHREHIMFLGNPVTALTYDNYSAWHEPATAWMPSGPADFSLRDAGVDQPAPRYNQHGLTDSLVDALLYIEALYHATTHPGTPPPKAVVKQEETPNEAYERAMRGI